MDIGIAYDLKSDFAPAASGPEDQLEEYDSEATVAGLEQALAANGYTPRRLGGGRRFLETVLARPPQLVFNIAEGRGSRSREAHVPAVLEMLGIPFTHSDPLTLAVTLDKAAAKHLVAAAGVPTPRFVVLEPDAGWPTGQTATRANTDEHRRTQTAPPPGAVAPRAQSGDPEPRVPNAGCLRSAVPEPRTPNPEPRPLALSGSPAVALCYPLLAKPLYEGSSMGIRLTSRVEDEAALRAAVERLWADYRQPVLVEEFCPGPEFTVGVLGTGAEARAIAVMEIVPRSRPLETFLYSLEIKRNWETEVEYHVPPKRPEELVQSVARVAVAAYRALGCRDVGRVDLRLGRDGEPKFLEVNPLPGLNWRTGDLVILSGKAGLDYNGLVGAVVASARKRYGL